MKKWGIALACALLWWGAILVRASQLVYPDTPETKSSFLLSYNPEPAISEFGKPCSAGTHEGGEARWRAVRYWRERDFWVRIDLERADDMVRALQQDVVEALGKSGAQIRKRAVAAGKYTVEYDLGKTRGQVSVGPVSVAGKEQGCEKLPTVIAEFGIRETWTK